MQRKSPSPTSERDGKSHHAHSGFQTPIVERLMRRLPCSMIRNAMNASHLGSSEMIPDQPDGETRVEGESQRGERGIGQLVVEIRHDAIIVHSGKIAPLRGQAIRVALGSHRADVDSRGTLDPETQILVFRLHAEVEMPHDGHIRKGRVAGAGQSVALLKHEPAVLGSQSRAV